MHNYAQFPLVLTSGKGCFVTDVKGKEYLDLVGGIAVNALGYHDTALSAELKNVIDGGLLHCSNLYWNPYAIEAAELLVKLSGMQRVFFCNSGTEANEAAIKLARKWGQKKARGKSDIITFEHSFHGRTYASMTATGQRKYQESFVPLVPGFSYAPFNDLEAVQALMSESTCAIMVEPIQGEGGIRPASAQFLQGLRRLCDEHELLLIFDEVQCGLGRSGNYFAFQNYQVKPDLVSIAKALAGGVPMGALVAQGEAAEVFEPGDHAATFGGNLLASAAATVVLRRLSQAEFLPAVREVAQHLQAGLTQLATQFSSIVEVRGQGLMMGIEFTFAVRTLIEKCLEKGLLVASSGANVVRFVPPLIISKDELDIALKILKECLIELQAD